MIKILSIENSLDWSWGISINQLIKYSKFDFIRVVRTPKVKLSKRLVSSYRIILAQNVDILHLLRCGQSNTIVRMGGMYLNSGVDKNRHNKELKRAGAVIATNKQLYDIAQEANPNTCIIPNGVDLEVFYPARIKEKRTFTVGFAGNIWGTGGTYKGWQFYIAATLSLYGDVLRKECLHRGPDGMTQIEHEDMPKDFYHQIDCLILPSENEGCSNTITEALACGVPVLCTEVGYHGENLTDGKEVLFIKRDAEDICKKVLMLINDPALRKRLSKGGRRFVRKNQNIKDIARKYDVIFTQILNDKAHVIAGP